MRPRPQTKIYNNTNITATLLRKSRRLATRQVSCPRRHRRRAARKPALKRHGQFSIWSGTQQVRDVEHLRVAEHLLNLHVEVEADQASFIIAVDVGSLLLEPPMLPLQYEAAQYFSKSVDVVHDVVRVVVLRFHATCQGPCVFQACEPRLGPA